MRAFLCVAGGLLALGLAGSAAALQRAAAASELVFSSTFAGNREIFVSGADGSNRVDVSRDPHADITPAWSADGTRIAFASDRSGAFELYVMNADGSNVVQVTHDGAYDDHPHFNGDDKALVYESNRGGNWEIRRIGIDGSSETDLTRNRAADRFPTTAPRGAIVFTSDRGGGGQHLWIMRWNGTARRKLTRQAGGQSQPTFDPTGAKLAFVAGAPGQGTSVWSMLRNGTHLRRLASAAGHDELSPAWSPDGSSIAYQDCSAGVPSSCDLMTVAPGSAPFDVSTLRAPFLDTFDGGDSRFWQVITNGTGATNTEQNGQLVTTLAADSVQGGQYDAIETHWGTQCRLVGDFDVQADYHLFEWPAANGVQASLSSFAGPSNIGFMALRESQTWGEQYSSWIPPDFLSAATTDVVGTLRLQRKGDTAVTSYWSRSSSSWIGLASGPTSTEPASITLGASSFMNRFVHQEVKVGWDNFRINAGTISCDPRWWEDDSPDWHALPGAGSGVR
jgi:Tol biopolymer transport system component